MTDAYVTGLLRAGVATICSQVPGQEDTHWAAHKSTVSVLTHIAQKCTSRASRDSFCVRCVGNEGRPVLRTRRHHRDRGRMRDAFASRGTD